MAHVAREGTHPREIDCDSIPLYRELTYIDPILLWSEEDDDPPPWWLKQEEPLKKEA